MNVLLTNNAVKKYILYKFINIILIGFLHKCEILMKFTTRDTENLGNPTILFVFYTRLKLNIFTTFSHKSKMSHNPPVIFWLLQRTGVLNLYGNWLVSRCGKCILGKILPASLKLVLMFETVSIAEVRSSKPLTHTSSWSFCLYHHIIMAAVMDMTNEDTVLVAMESTACEPHHAVLPELSGVSSITSQVIRLQLHS